MLKQRLISGTLMTLFFAGVVIFDGWLDGSLTASTADNKAVQGTIFCILIAILVIPAQLEFSKLAKTKGINIFTTLVTAVSILFATSWYWFQFITLEREVCFVLLSVFALFGLLLTQYVRYGTTGVLANCGANCFSIMYLGILSAFVPAIRIEYGVWPLLMFIFVVKFADIGAYTIGSIFGKHQFSPKISPKKTWEGMAGAVVLGVLIALLFGRVFGIMNWKSAAVFGIGFAFIGQCGDLAESLIKRDTGQKDSSSSVPGFGGMLDVIDSPLAAAPFAYLFFRLGCL
jgi:phosphatidate cytidylyltransferase